MLYWKNYKYMYLNAQLTLKYTDCTALKYITYGVQLTLQMLKNF